MAKRKRYKKNDPGPNPDPERYILVHTKEGSYYRLKRGLNKPALLNAAYQQSADSTRICSPAASRIAAALRKDLCGLNTGRMIAHFTGLLKKALHKNGKLDFSFFVGYDFQADHPFDNLLRVPYRCQEKDGNIELQIRLIRKAVKKHSPLVSQYYFDLVLLCGDPTKDDGLRVETDTSLNYSYDLSKEETCKLSITLPEREQPWMVMLKVSSMEGNELAHHPRHYGMKVVKHGH
jgi:hypothetical protein